jgi:hypothetical protein
VSDDRAAASTTMIIRPWADPVVDDDGFDPRSRYVETFWLGTLGPTATWLIRRLATRLDDAPDGFELDLTATARAMGLGYSAGRTSAFTKALQRLVMFGLAHPVDGGLAVRRRLPAASSRHLQRLPEEVRTAHERWHSAQIDTDELTRAHELARVLVDTGDDPSIVEHRLAALGVRDAVAALVADNVSRLAAP